MKRCVSKRAVKKIVPLVVVFLLVVSIPALFVGGGLTPHEVRSFASRFGVAAPLSLIIATALTNVIPPLAVTPFWIASILLFGGFGGFVISYVANLLGSSANFFISRLWGRPAVARVAGAGALRKIDKIPNIANPLAVFMLKFVGGAATDYISYASGLSKIKYLGYLIASALSILPMMVIGFIIIGNVSFESMSSTFKALGLFYTINYLSTLLLVPIGYLFFERPEIVKSEEKKFAKVFHIHLKKHKFS